MPKISIPFTMAGVLIHLELRRFGMQRKASAVWKGGLKDGQGTVSSASGILSNTKYSFKTRFEDAPGTNPEELIAAAHAACFSMALSAQLGGANLTAESINTSATLAMEKQDSGWAITAGYHTTVGRAATIQFAPLPKRAHRLNNSIPVV